VSVGAAFDDDPDSTDSVGAGTVDADPVGAVSVGAGPVDVDSFGADPVGAEPLGNVFIGAVDTKSVGAAPETSSAGAEPVAVASVGAA
jgi:hypothetical protein